MEQASDVVELVLPHEVDNPNNVYLYLEGDAWCAYERSAYYLTQMEVPVVLKLVADDKLQFQIRDRVEGFSEWKENELKKLSA